MAGGLREYGRASIGKGVEFQPGLPDPASTAVRARLRRGSINGHRKMRRVEVEGGFAGFIGSRPPPRLVRKERQNLDSGQSSFRMDHRESAGVSSIFAAGMRTRLDSSTTLYSGRMPVASRVSLRMIETPSPRRSIRYRRWFAPGTSPTGTRPNMEAMTSLRVAWLAFALDGHAVGKAGRESRSRAVLEHDNLIRRDDIE